MNRRFLSITAGALALLALLLFLALRSNRSEELRSTLLLPEAEVTDLSGFARATDPSALTFPDAFGPHPDYQTEWWYYTGNLQTAEGRSFGYQLTFFRRSLLPGEPDRPSALATRSVYMAHLAVTDAASNEFYMHERFQRGAGGVAGAQASPYRVWLDNWTVEEVGPDSYQMQARQGAIAIDLTLHSLKPPVLQGNNGLSPKGPEPGNASYYYSQTRLQTEGTITVPAGRFEVTGFSWKDHEYGTSALPEHAVGWDWFALQLSDGRELMYYHLRTEEGGIEPASTSVLVAEDGTVQRLARDEIQIEVLDSWKSPATGISYPARWRLRIPSKSIELTITPLIPNQELNAVSVVYWEGAVTLEGVADGQSVSGRGYVELTGYQGAQVPSF